jgi:hypothetical protein
MTPEYDIPPLPLPRSGPPNSTIGRFLLAGEPLDQPDEHATRHSWRRVLWLTGVDYFSTLGYQPGIALLAAGALSPIATLILVAVTLLGAVPVYAQVARRSYAGQGSIAMLESLLPEWRGKILVLALLGFAATDFVITMTLSAADAAQHAVENPLVRPFIGDHRMLLTLGLLSLLAGVFLIGFREAIGIARLVAIPYIVLNLVVLARGLAEIALHPELLRAWRLGLRMHGDTSALLLASAIIFPKLALGLSGFETGVSVMPLVAGGSEDAAGPVPHGRIRATRRLLVAAALIMSVLLILSSLVTTLLIPPAAYAEGGPAAGRAIAWLAHGLLGHAFGTLYDLWTIAILGFAGASAMTGLLSLVPRYLPRFGMAPQWTSYRRPMVLMLFAVCAVVTLVFRANVEAQGGAYATGVLVLILSAAFAVALALWKEFRAAGLLKGAPILAQSAYFWIVALVFAYTLVDNVVARPDGVIIATIFVLGILGAGAASRTLRATELRVSGIRIADDESAALWKTMVGKKVNLVPVRTATPAEQAKKAAELRAHYRIQGPLAFIHVALMDNRSEFLAPLRLRVQRAGEDFVIEVSGAIAIANTIAYISELLDPITLFLGLTGRNLMTQALRYLLVGEGEVALMVYKILVRYWHETPEDDVRPQIFLMSDPT